MTEEIISASDVGEISELIQEEFRVEDGIIHNPEQVSTPLYFYDPSRMSYMTESSSGTSLTKPMPTNATFTDVGKFDESKEIRIYDPDDDSWYSIGLECHVLDDNGFYVDTVKNPLLKTDQDPLPDNTEILGFDGLDNAWFDKELQAWLDKPVLENLKKPAFDKTAKNWIESATHAEFIELLKVERNSRLSKLDKPLLLKSLNEADSEIVDLYYSSVRYIDLSLIHI